MLRQWNVHQTSPSFNKTMGKAKSRVSASLLRHLHALRYSFADTCAARLACLWKLRGRSQICGNENWFIEAHFCDRRKLEDDVVCLS